MPVILEITTGPTGSRRLVVEGSRSVRVGRAREAELSLPEDPMLSRLHFLVQSDDEGGRIRDLGSANGTFVNGQRLVADRRLRDGDEIRAGRTRIVVQLSQRNAPIGPPVAASPTEDLSAEVGSPSSGSAAAETIEPRRFTTATLIWEDLQGVPRMTVVVKCTGRMRGDGKAAELAEEPLPIFTSDVPEGEAPGDPLLFETDLVPLKPRADVVLVGKAYYPRHKPPGASVDVTLRVGSLTKTIRVFGDRKWWFPSKLTLQPEITPPQPFQVMDLSYARAFGGIDEASSLYCAENLAGRGFLGRKSRESIHEKPLPNLEDPACLIEHWDSRPKPAGFGFYGRGWSPRLQLAGAGLDQKVGPNRSTVWPPGFDFGFFNGAHPDLQVPGYLRGDEEVELRNVTPSSFLEFRLPGLRPRIVVSRWLSSPVEWLESQQAIGREVTLQDVPRSEEPVRSVLDTLVLLPEKRLFYLIFRGNVELSGVEAPEIAGIQVTLEPLRSKADRDPSATVRGRR